MRCVLLALALLAVAAPAKAQQGPCPPQGYDRAQLDALKANDWSIPDARGRNRFARAIAACLASPDPQLRDGIAYEALASLLRANALTPATQTALVNDLELQLAGEDANGVARPFAALALSELARADRLAPYLSAADRNDLLDRAIAYFTGVSDYRGFDETDGWRHGVAHGADLLMQLAANPLFERAALVRIRDAVATQIAPAGHFYIYGESERLARPILVIAQRNVFSAEEWSAWQAQIAAPAPLASWSDAFASQAGLARKHDVAAFFYVLWANASLSENEGVRALAPGAEAALRALP